MTRIKVLYTSTMITNNARNATTETIFFLEKIKYRHAPMKVVLTATTIYSGTKMYAKLDTVNQITTDLTARTAPTPFFAGSKVNITSILTTANVQVKITSHIMKTPPTAVTKTSTKHKPKMLTMTKVTIATWMTKINTR